MSCVSRLSCFEFSACCVVKPRRSQVSRLFEPGVHPGFPSEGVRSFRSLRRVLKVQKGGVAEGQMQRSGMVEFSPSLIPDGVSGWRWHLVGVHVGVLVETCPLLTTDTAMPIWRHGGLAMAAPANP